MKRKAYKILSIEKQYLQYDYVVINCENGITKFIKQQYHNLFLDDVRQYQPKKGDYLIEYINKKGTPYYSYEDAALYDTVFKKSSIKPNNSLGLRECTHSSITHNLIDITLDNLANFLDYLNSENYKQSKEYKTRQITSLLNDTEMLKNLNVDSIVKLINNYD